MKNISAGLLGVLFGIVLTKSEVNSWFRIQDMFYFRDPMLYLIIGSAVAVGMLGLFVVRKFSSQQFDISEKPLNKGTMIGGFIFGVGWFITGACPGPIFSQIGAGAFPAVVTLLGALFGAFVYAEFKSKLPH